MALYRSWYLRLFGPYYVDDKCPTYWGTHGCDRRPHRWGHHWCGCGENSKGRETYK